MDLQDLLENEVRLVKEVLLDSQVHLAQVERGVQLVLLGQLDLQVKQVPREKGVHLV